MVEIFFQEKTQSNFLTLKVITKKDNFNPLVEKKEWKSTLISEEKICYLFIDKESGSYNFHSIYEYFVNFSSSNEKSWNVDIKSFVTKTLPEEEVIEAISEGIFFGSHQQINYKQKETKKLTRIITS